MISFKEYIKEMFDKPYSFTTTDNVSSNSRIEESIAKILTERGSLGDHWFWEPD